MAEPTREPEEIGGREGGLEVRTRPAGRSADVLALFFLALVPTILFVDVMFLGETFFYRDLTNYFYPAKRIVRDIVLSGHVPYWNHWFSGGQPLAANPEFQVFYPLQALILLPDYDLGYRLHIVLHIHLGLAGMYLLLRSMSLRIFSAIFGALTFGLGGFYLSYVNIPPFFFTLAWLPLTLLFFRRFLLRPNSRAFALACLFLGMQLLACEPTTVLQSGALVAAYAIYRGVRDGSGRLARSVSRRLLQTAAVVAGGSAIGCVQILPMLDLVRDTARAGGFNSFELISIWSMPPVRVIELFFPGFMGPLQNSGLLYWGSAAYGGRAPYLPSIHFGGLAAVLAFSGALVGVRGRLLILVLAASSFLLAIGNHTPLLRALFDLGIFRSFRYPEKFILIAIFSLIVMAALAFDRAIGGDRRIIRVGIAVALGLAAVAAGLALLSRSDIYAEFFTRYWSLSPDAPRATMIQRSGADWLRAALMFAIGAAFLYVLLRRGPSRGWCAALLAFVVYEAGNRANQILERMPARFLDPPPVVNAIGGASPQFRLVHEEQIDLDLGRRLPWAGSESFWLYRNGLFARTPSAWGFRTVLDGDYDLTNLAPTRDLYEALLRTRDRGLRRTPETFLAISNVGYVAELRGEDPRRFLRDPEHQMPVTVSRRDYPRYYFADQIIAVRDFEDFVEKAIRGGWSRRVAFVQFPPYRPAPGAILSLEEEPNRTLLSVEAAGPSFLVISVTPHKYWRATLDGLEAGLVRTNVGYQGISVPAGRHVVELRYRNPLIVVGALISVLSILCATLGAIRSPARPSEVRSDG